MNRKTYQLTATREGRWWIVDVPELGHRTQAAKLSEIDEMGRDLIALMEDVEPESFDIESAGLVPSGVEAQLEEAARLDREARAATAEAARDRRAAARSLRETHGLPAAEVAQVLGVTRARVYQLLNDDRPAEVATSV